MCSLRQRVSASGLGPPPGQQTGRTVLVAQVRQHSGGIDPGRVRLRPGGASEPRTSPGRDIRDLTKSVSIAQHDAVCSSCGSDQGLRRVGRSSRCIKCFADAEIVRVARVKLKALKQPPLMQAAPAGAPGAKIRKGGQRALERMRARATKRSRSAAGRPSSKPLKPKVKRGPKAKQTRRASSPTLPFCPGCNVQMAATRVCEACA